MKATASGMYQSDTAHKGIGLHMITPSLKQLISINFENLKEMVQAVILP